MSCVLTMSSTFFPPFTGGVLANDAEIDADVAHRLSMEYASAEEVLRNLRDSLFVVQSNSGRSSSYNVLNVNANNSEGSDKTLRGDSPSLSPCPSPGTVLLSPSRANNNNNNLLPSPSRPASATSQMILQTFPHRRCESSASVNVVASGPTSPVRWSVNASPDHEVVGVHHHRGMYDDHHHQGEREREREVSRSQMTSPVFVQQGGGRGAYWGGHLKPEKYRRRNPSNAASSVAPVRAAGECSTLLRNNYTMFDFFFFSSSSSFCDKSEPQLTNSLPNRAVNFLVGVESTQVAVL